MASALPRRHAISSLLSTLRSHPVHTCASSPVLQRRTFFNLGSLGSLSSSSPAPPLRIHETRTLPYGRAALYGLISDIADYPSFIPFCTGASVDSRSADADPVAGKRWPATATLHVGFGGYRESYLSRVYCVPYSALEAVAGRGAKTSLSAAELKHYGPTEDASEGGEEDAESGGKNELFTSLRARWTLKPAEGEVGERRGAGGGGESTLVSLAIEAHWKSGLLASVSKEVAPGVAGRIIQAFERRANEVLG